MRHGHRPGAVLAFIALLLGTLSVPAAAGTWFDTWTLGPWTLRSGTVDIVTPGAASSGRLATWDALLELNPPDLVTYAAVTDPAAVVQNTGTVPLFFGVSATSSGAAPDSETTNEGAAALATNLRASLAVVAGSTCDAAAFDAGILVADRNPLGADAANLPIPPGTALLAVGEQRTLCARYVHSGAGAGTWGRTLSVTWDLIAANQPTGTFVSNPVVWRHLVRMHVPAPQPQSGTGAGAKCVTIPGTVLPLVRTSFRLNWAWPTASGFGQSVEAAAGFDIVVDGIWRASVGGSIRTWTASQGLLATLLGALLGDTMEVVVLARAGDGTSLGTFSQRVRSTLLPVGLRCD